MTWIYRYAVFHIVWKRAFVALSLPLGRHQDAAQLPCDDRWTDFPSGSYCVPDVQSYLSTPLQTITTMAAAAGAPGLNVDPPKRANGGRPAYDYLVRDPHTVATHSIAPI